MTFANRLQATGWIVFLQSDHSSIRHYLVNNPCCSLAGSLPRIYSLQNHPLCYVRPMSEDDDTSIQIALLTAKRFCHEILIRMKPTNEQCIHIGSTLRALEEFPSVPDISVEVSLISNTGRSHLSWSLQIDDNSISLSVGGSDEGMDSFTRYSCYIRNDDYGQLGEAVDFDAIFHEQELDDFVLHTHSYKK